jgi:hypothetical protein
MIVRFRLDDEAITLQTNAFPAMSKAKYSKAGIHPAAFKLADLWGSQGLHNHRVTHRLHWYDMSACRHPPLCERILELAESRHVRPTKIGWKYREV